MKIIFQIITFVTNYFSINDLRVMNLKNAFLKYYLLVVYKISLLQVTANYSI